MSKNTGRLWFRISPELKAKLDEYVSLVPGGRADVIREALDQHLSRNLPIMRAMHAHNNGGQDGANAPPP